MTRPLTESRSGIADPRISSRRLRGGFIVFGLAAALAVSGCQSSGKPAASSFAGVEIYGRSPDEIRETTVAVFGAEGYAGFAHATGGMVFQKDGSRANHLAFGGLISTSEGNRVIVRVKANIVEVGEDRHRLECQAFIVRHAGDTFFEEEQKFAKFRSGQFQKMLEEVANRLKQTPP